MAAIDEIQLLREMQTLRQENARLKAEIAELERRREIVIKNAYEEGYNAGRDDTLNRTKLSLR
jgi:cell division protein FtsB